MQNEVVVDPLLSAVGAATNNTNTTLNGTASNFLVEQQESLATGETLQRVCDALFIRTIKDKSTKKKHY